MSFHHVRYSHGTDSPGGTSVNHALSSLTVGGIIHFWLHSILGAVVRYGPDMEINEYTR